MDAKTAVKHAAKGSFKAIHAPVQYSSSCMGRPCGAFFVMAGQEEE
jgi:hypothetical protein